MPITSIASNTKDGIASGYPTISRELSIGLWVVCVTFCMCNGLVLKETCKLFHELTTIVSLDCAWHSSCCFLKDVLHRLGHCGCLLVLHGHKPCMLRETVNYCEQIVLNFAILWAAVLAHVHKVSPPALHGLPCHNGPADLVLFTCCTNW